LKSWSKRPSSFSYAEETAQFKKQGIKHNWTDTTRIMSTQKVVTTTSENKLGEIIAFRNGTTPQTKVTEIYEMP
jgi:hypothetical protein